MRIFFIGLTIVLVSALCYVTSTRLGLRSDYATLLSTFLSTLVFIWMLYATDKDKNDKPNDKNPSD